MEVSLPLLSSKFKRGTVVAYRLFPKEQLHNIVLRSCG